MEKTNKLHITLHSSFRPGHFDNFNEKIAKELENYLPVHIDLDYNPSKTYDAHIIFNKLKTDLIFKTYKGNVFTVMGESGFGKLLHPSMYYRLEQFDLVFSPLKQSENTVQSHGYLDWHLKRSYKQLKELHYPTKKKSLSCIMSSYNSLSGIYTKRLYFRELLKKSGLDIDFFGKESNFIRDKYDGLANYYYSIAIENSSKPYYFTEKIIDCFLSYTTPFYYGCNNIHKYFPSKSYIWIDINNPKKAIKKIRDTIEFEDPKERIPYLEEARKIVLEKHTIFGLIKRLEPMIRENKKNNVIKTYTIKSIVKHPLNDYLFFSLIIKAVKFLNISLGSLYLKILLFISRLKTTR